MANRIGTPFLWIPAISVRSVIVVAADISVKALAVAIIMIQIIWIERYPRWIINIKTYFSNCYCVCRIFVSTFISLISAKFKSIQPSIVIVVIMIQEHRINFSVILRFVNFLHLKKIYVIVVFTFSINGIYFYLFIIYPTTWHCKIERVSSRHSPLHTNCLHVIHACCGVHLLRLFGRFRGGGGGGSGGHGRHRGGRCGGCRFRGRGGFCRGLRRFGRGGLLRPGALFRFRGGGVLLRRNGILPGGRSRLILQQLYFVRCVGQKIHLGVYRQGHCHNQASGDKQRCQPARPTCCVVSCSIQSAHPSFALA